MNGGNGFSPIANLSEKQKCPEHPSKRRYKTSEEATAAAEARSREAKMEIGAYACPACGSFHLTSRSAGLTLQGGKYTTGDKSPAIPQRMAILPEPEPEEETPPMPGDLETRAKAVRGWLALNPDAEPTNATLKPIIGVTTSSAIAKVMTHVGFTMAGHGRSSRWVRDAPSASETRLKRLAAVVGPTEEEIAAERRWAIVDVDVLDGFMLTDLLDVYRAAGMEVRLQVRPA